MGAVDVAEVAVTPRSTNDELEAVLPKDGIPWYRKSYLIKTNICVISLMLFSGSNGFDGSLMNGLLALPQWREFMDSPSGAWLGFINGIYSLGCAVGYPVAAWVSNRYGRKFPVWISLAMCAIGIAVQTSAKDDVSFVVARLFQGFSQGFTLSVPENPIKVLAAFSKTSLDAGESRVVELTVKARDFASWSEKEHKWVIEAGDYDFSLGRNAADLVSTVKVAVKAQSEGP